MLKTLKYALLAGVLFALAPSAMAETPADTLVIAKQIDDIISLDPAEAYELSGIEILANTYDRIMRFEPTDVTKLVGGVAESVDRQRGRQDLHLQDPPEPEVRLRQSGDGGGRGLFAAARDQAREDPGLPAHAARLDQGQCRQAGDSAR